MLPVRPYQQKTGLCGVASLKMTLDFFGCDASEERLIRLSGASPEKGTSVQGMQIAAGALGFSLVCQDNADFEDIKRYLDNKIPAILDWFSEDEGHYSVAVDLDGDFIYLQDPEIADMRKLKRDDFLRVWFDFEGEFMKSKDDLILRRLIVIAPK